MLMILPLVHSGWPLLVLTVLLNYNIIKVSLDMYIYNLVFVFHFQVFSKQSEHVCEFTTCM